MKIGICWQGNPKYRDDRFRSIPLVAFQPLAELSDVQLISLQKHNGLDQLAQFQDAWAILDLDQEIDNDVGPFMDTAAILRCLNLVVTSDTVIAHRTRHTGLGCAG
jgi:hypothetical protein